MVSPGAGLHEMKGGRIEMPMKRIISATVINQTGVLNRITGVLSRRRFNIENISVAAYR